MDLTRQEYDKYVKPLFDKLYEIDLSFEEDMLAGDFIRKLFEAEFNLEKLETLLGAETTLQREFMEKRCSKEAARLEKFLKEKKT